MRPAPNALRCSKRARDILDRAQRIYICYSQSLWVWEDVYESVHHGLRGGRCYRGRQCRGAQQRAGFVRECLSQLDRRAAGHVEPYYTHRLKRRLKALRRGTSARDLHMRQSFICCSRRTYKGNANSKDL